MAFTLRELYEVLLQIGFRVHLLGSGGIAVELSSSIELILDTAENWFHQAGLVTLAQSYGLTQNLKYRKRCENVLLTASAEGWNLISSCGDLSECFLLKFHRNLNFELLVKNQKLSTFFLYIMKQRLDWSLVSNYQKLTEQEIRYFGNKINWTLACQSVNTVSEDFIIENLDRVHVCLLLESRRFSLDFIYHILLTKCLSVECIIHSISVIVKYFPTNVLKNILFERDVLADLLCDHKIEEDFLQFLVDILRENFDTELIKDIFKYICKKQNLSVAFMRKNLEYLDWDDITIFQTLPENFIVENIRQFDLCAVANFQTVSQTFHENYFMPLCYYESTDETCPICLSLCSNTRMVQIKVCRHVFCKSCLKTWLMNNKTCPVCRYKISAHNKCACGNCVN